MESWITAINQQIQAIERREEDAFQEVWRRLGNLIYHQPPSKEEDDDDDPFIHVDGGRNAARMRSLSTPELSLSDLVCAMPTIPIPRMHIVIMVVGTRGDVQPFTVLGKLLQSSGHRVRLATHEMYREQVMECGLEFYPLEGDPTKLSAFMVKRSGRIFPKLYDKEEMLKDLPEQFSMMREIIRSTWPACTVRLNDNLCILSFPTSSRLILAVVHLFSLPPNRLLTRKILLNALSLPMPSSPTL